MSKLPKQDAKWNRDGRRRLTHLIFSDGAELMRASLTLAVAAWLTAGSCVVAQDANQASPGTGTGTGSSNASVNGTGNASSSVNASGTVNVVDAAALEKGANSFTSGQAKSRIESAGFQNVSDLTKDDQGIWRGMAMRDGKQVKVGFDYKGNIAAQ